MTATLPLGTPERAVTPSERRTDPEVTRFEYRPALDGLRTVAVYLVVAFHAGVVQFSGGFIGVDLFFVLSGYLVTSVMLTEYDANGRIDLVRFYARRVRRLLPAAVVAVVSIAVASLFIDSPLTRSGFLGAARSALLYFSNWHFIGDKTDYFARDANDNPYLHFWSLSVEEQFYVAFPLLLIGLLFVSRRRRRVVAGSVAVVAGALVALQLFWNDRNPVRAYYGTDARTYQMVVGALLAVTFTIPEVQRFLARVNRWVPAAASVLLLAGLIGAATDALDVDASARGFIAAGLALGLIAALDRSTGPVAWLLSRNTVVQLGRVSYGTYLWHWPVIVYAKQVLDLGPVALAVFAAITATAMAFLSYTLLEMPIRTAPRLIHRSPQVVVSGLLVSAFAAIALVPPIINNTRLPVVNVAQADGLGVDAPPVSTGNSVATTEPSGATEATGSIEPVAAPDSPADAGVTTEAVATTDAVATTEATGTTAATETAETTEPRPNLQMSAGMGLVTIEPSDADETAAPAPETTDSPPAIVATTDVEPTPESTAPELPAPDETVPPGIDLAQAATYPVGVFGCADGEPADCILVQGDGPHVFVMGDSNASMLMPMFEELAAEHDFTLSAITSAGCAWQDGLGWVVEDQTRLDDCVRARDDAYERVIPALQPDIIIGVHIPRDDPSRDNHSPFFALDESDGTGFDGIATTTRRSLDEFEALGTEVIIIEPLPFANNADTVECLSGTIYVMDCAFETTSEPSPMEQLYRDEAEARSEVSSIDLDTVFCPNKPVCAPIVGGELIFRDAYHVYPPYAVDHREQIWAVFEATGAFDS